MLQLVMSSGDVRWGNGAVILAVGVANNKYNLLSLCYILITCITFKVDCDHYAKPLVNHTFYKPNIIEFKFKPLILEHQL